MQEKRDRGWLSVAFQPFTDTSPDFSSVAGPPVSRRSCVIFDFDGTLADTTQAVISCARIALSEYGMSEEDMGDLHRLIGPPFPAGYTMIYGIPPADAERICARYREIYGALGHEGHPLYPGMGDLLRRLRDSGRRLAVASSKLERMVKPMLADNGVLDLFECVSAQLDPAHADKPYLIANALRCLGAEPDDAVMVGDRNYDIIGAQKVGVPCVAVLFGTAPRSELEEAGAIGIAESAEELGAMLMGAAEKADPSGGGARPAGSSAH
jgi:phosphoglycolate phosphatase